MVPVEPEADEGEPVAAGLSPEQIAVLAEFADTMRAAQKMGKVLGWTAGIATGAAVLLYYVLSVINTLRANIPHAGVH